MDTLITVDAIKKEIEDEVEVPVIWRPEDINEVDPLADVKTEEIEGAEVSLKVLIPNLVPKAEAELIQSSTLLHDCPIISEPNLLEELGVIKDLVPFQDIKPNPLPKEDGDLSDHDCQIESDGDIKDDGVVHDLVPKVKTETPSTAVKRELRICLKELGVIKDLVPFQDIKPNPLPKEDGDLSDHDCQIESDGDIKELGVIKDLVPFQDIKPNPLPKEDGDLSDHDCQIESDGDMKDDGVVHDLVPKVKTETPSTAVKRELRICLKRLSVADLVVKVKPPCAVEPLMETDNKDYGVVHDLVPKVKTETPSTAVKRELRICLKRLSVADLVGKVKPPCAVEPLMETDNKGSEGVQGSDPLNEPLKVRESGTRQVGRHRKSKMSADSNISSSTTNVLTKTTYTCEMCNICFNSQVRYKKHLLNHSESELLSCAHCSYKTLYKDKLISHMKKHLGVKKQYRCKDCSFKYYWPSSLKLHIRTHTGEKPYVCKVCPQTFALASTLIAHMRTHSGEKPFSCKVCSFKCSHSSYLKIHMRTHSGEKPYVCKVCSKKFSNSQSLIVHKRIHTGEKPFACKVCSYKCSLSSTLIVHKRIHTGEKPFACKVCSYKCSKSNYLKTHMRTHTGEKPYVCKVCPYKSSQLGLLKRHIMSIHSGEKPFACKICSYKGSNSTNLKTHMRIHTGEKPFACKVCSYKCSYYNSLKTHMRTHTGEKPFACKVCSYKCSQLGRLKRHIMCIHSGEKPYACDVCSYKCSRSYYLVTHKLIHKRKKQTERFVK